MKLSTMLSSAPRRAAALGMLAVLAAAVALPATALAAPKTPAATRCTNVQCVIAFGDTAITNRLNVLSTLNTKATNEHNAGHISDAIFGSISGDVSSDTQGLTQLKTKLDAETNITAARQDVKNIYFQFRVYAVVLPRDYREIWYGEMSFVDQKLRALQPKIENAIAHAPANEQAQLNQLYSDYKGQLQEAESQLDAAQGQFATLTVNNFNNAQSVYETALSDTKTDEQTAHRDLHQAASDLHQITGILKGGTGAHPAATATASS
jgi:hypothetical protein